MKKILITGKPACGKTTLIKEIIKESKRPAFGFYTQEIREKDRKRAGFLIISTDGKKGILAHKKFESKFRVGRYGVNIEDLEKIGVRVVLEGLKDKENLIVIDEIGKMELFSEKFKEAVSEALDSQNPVLATIKLTSDKFCDKVKKRKDVVIFNLDQTNFNFLKETIKKLIKNV
jgi:nucleoside-triphosphatase